MGKFRMNPLTGTLEKVSDVESLPKQDVQAAKELAHRKKIEKNNDNIWTRAWY